MIEDGYNATYNDPALARRLIATFTAAFGKDRVVEPRPIMGAEDFGDIGKAAGVPSVKFWLGAVEQAKWDAAQGERDEAAVAPLVALGARQGADPENGSGGADRGGARSAGEPEVGGARRPPAPILHDFPAWANLLDYRLFRIGQTSVTVASLGAALVLFAVLVDLSRRCTASSSTGCSPARACRSGLRYASAASPPTSCSSSGGGRA